jgi:hypothetical protein
VHVDFVPVWLDGGQEAAILDLDSGTHARLPAWLVRLLCIYVNLLWLDLD